jgi:hypothetical protein
MIHTRSHTECGTERMTKKTDPEKQVTDKVCPIGKQLNIFIGCGGGRRFTLT